MRTTYAALFAEGEACLRAAKVAEAELDAWYLLSYVMGLSRTKWLMERMTEREIPQKDILCYYELIQRRAERIPLQHLTGEQEFMGFSFLVNEDVLIPRQDTEVLVEEILKREKGGALLDMCTGSGCIAISLALLGTFEMVAGSDFSAQALAVARKNAAALSAAVSFTQGDLFEAAWGEFDIVVSNPPYIPKGVIEDLEPEVRDHDPRPALEAGEDGLLFYRRICAEARPHLRIGGRIYFEIGREQAKAVSLILEETGYDEILVLPDLTGSDRVVAAVRRV